MTIHTTSQPAGRLPTRSGAQTAALTAALALASLLLCGTVAASKPAEAAPTLCGDRDQILERLEQTREEKPQAPGLSGDGGVIEVLVSPEGGWTMLITYPKRPTCVVAVGEAWQTQVAGESA